MAFAPGNAAGSLWVMLDDQLVWEWHRVHWQIELAFKRLKSPNGETPAPLIVAVQFPDQQLSPHAGAATF